MNKEEIESYFNQIKQEYIKKLLDVGFTKEQAEVLMEIIETKSFSSGLF